MAAVPIKPGSRVREGLADGVDLRDVTAAAHADAHVDLLEALLAKKQHRLVDLRVPQPESLARFTIVSSAARGP